MTREGPGGSGGPHSHIHIDRISTLDNRGGFFGISYNGRGDGGERSAAEPGKGGGSGADRDGEPGHSDYEGEVRREGLTEREIAALARIYDTPQRARSLLARAGAPVERSPAWGDPISFWYSMSELLGHGILANGRRKILDVAASDFPANPTFGSDRS